MRTPKAGQTFGVFHMQNLLNGQGLHKSGRGNSPTRGFYNLNLSNQNRVANLVRKRISVRTCLV